MKRKLTSGRVWNTQINIPEIYIFHISLEKLDLTNEPNRLPIALLRPNKFHVNFLKSECKVFKEKKKNLLRVLEKNKGKCLSSQIGESLSNYKKRLTDN